MPKGGALHLHEYSLVSTEWLLTNVSYRLGLFMCEGEGGWLQYAWFTKTPADLTCNWVSVQTARSNEGNKVVDDKILRSMQFMSDTYVHGNLTWAWSNFEKGSVYKKDDCQPKTFLPNNELLRCNL